MKCVVFCLLTFCAFQPVFTWVERIVNSDMKNLRHKSMNLMGEIYSRLISDVYAAAKATEHKGLDPNEVVHNCWSTDTYEQFKQDYNTGVFQCNECYKKAAKKWTSKLAKKCCINEIAALENMRKLIHASVETCIAKYVHKAQVAAGRGPRGAARDNKEQL